MKNLTKIAFERRLDVLEMVRCAKTGHIGGSMSCMDALVCLYYEVMDAQKILRKEPDRDRFILSNGHNGEALYTILADLGSNSKTRRDILARGCSFFCSAEFLPEQSAKKPDRFAC